MWGEATVMWISRLSRTRVTRESGVQQSGNLLLYDESRMASRRFYSLERCKDQEKQAIFRHISKEHA